MNNQPIRKQLKEKQELFYDTFSFDTVDALQTLFGETFYQSNVDDLNQWDKGAEDVWLWVCANTDKTKADMLSEWSREWTYKQFPFATSYFAIDKQYYKIYGDSRTLCKIAMSHGGAIYFQRTHSEMIMDVNSTKFRLGEESNCIYIDIDNSDAKTLLIVA